MIEPLHDEAAALRRSVRVLITVADNVRRGALPHRALDRIVSPQVAADIVTELGSTITSGMSEVRSIHIQQPDPTTVYFTGSARRPDDTAVAYLGLITRAGDHERWRITQVLPVNERTIGQPVQRTVSGAPRPRLEEFRDLITVGYLDPAIRLLGPIPDASHGQRHDWLDAATAVREHGETYQLGPRVVDDLQATPTTPPDSWRTARHIIDAYVTTYQVDVSRYASFETRLGAMRGRERYLEQSIQDLEAGR